MINKRRQKRYLKRCETDVISGDVKFKGFSTDFSLNGLFLKTSNPLDQDKVFDMVIYCPDGSIAKLKGKVKRTLKPSLRNTIKNPVGNLEREMGKGMKMPAGNTQRGLGKVTKKPVENVQRGMGIEIMEKDANYLHFIRSMLS